MSRPISWLPRLHQISQAVAHSVRSHYDRRDLETLFQLQPRSAQKLIEVLDSVQVGTSRLVDREELAAFLDRVRDTEDMTGLLEQLRKEKAQVSRRKVRSLVRRDLDPVSLSSLPPSIRLTRGRLELNFQTVEELGEAMLLLARILETDGEEFARSFEPVMPTQEPAESGEMTRLFAELEEMESTSCTAKKVR